MADPTETARRVLELSARAFDTRSLAYQQANEALAGAAEDLARALLESQAALAAAREERASAEAVALARHGTISALRADLARVTAERDEARDRLSEVVPVLDRVIEERDAALATAERFAKYVDAVAPHAAPAPPPAAVPGLVFGPFDEDGIRHAVAADGEHYEYQSHQHVLWLWRRGYDTETYATESEAIAAANAHNAARLKGGE